MTTDKNEEWNKELEVHYKNQNTASEEQIQRILREARYEMCDCSCHRTPGIIHFKACCNFCYIQKDDFVEIERIKEELRKQDENK